MKKILLILTLLISLTNLSYSDNHYPITRDSELMIAKIIMPNTGKGILLNWKNSMVPKSPIAQPITHHIVFLALVCHVCLHDQWNVSVAI